jgi:hypothetical protein
VGGPPAGPEGVGVLEGGGVAIGLGDPDRDEAVAVVAIDLRRGRLQPQRLLDDVRDGRAARRRLRQ